MVLIATPPQELSVPTVPYEDLVSSISYKERYPVNDVSVIWRLIAIHLMFHLLLKYMT